MAADWRRTAAAASLQNLTDINMTIVASQAIDAAHAYLVLAAEVCRNFRLRLLSQTRAGDAPFDLTADMERVRFAVERVGFAMERVTFAISWTRRLGTYHAASGHVFSIGAAQLGLQGVAPWWLQRWEGHHAGAAAHADMALLSLRSAFSHGAAARDVFYIMLESAPICDAWAHANELLLGRTTYELAMACAALERMRPAVVAKYSDAWMLLSRRRVRAWHPQAADDRQQ